MGLIHPGVLAPGEQSTRMEIRMPHSYENIKGWFDFDDIYDLAIRRTMPAHEPVFVEVGCYHGRSTCYLAEALLEYERRERRFGRTTFFLLEPV